jgi:hypothetical protein
MSAYAWSRWYVDAMARLGLDREKDKWIYGFNTLDGWSSFTKSDVIRLLDAMTALGGILPQDAPVAAAVQSRDGVCLLPESDETSQTDFQLSVRDAAMSDNGLADSLPPNAALREAVRRHRGDIAAGRGSVNDT